jgi:hypothetical protein
MGSHVAAVDSNERPVNVFCNLPLTQQKGHAVQVEVSL